jgi:hypothetical protein
MHKELDRQIAHLRDSDKGWVYRRDAADYLGKTVQKAVAALRETTGDKDVDVRTAAEDALGRASAVLAGIAPVAGRTYALRELAEACAKPGRREVSQEDDRYAVVVQLREGRSQKVVIQEFSRSEGRQLVQILTYCGGFDASTMPWALKTNTQLGRCAIAVAALDGQEQFVVVNCLPREEATPDQVVETVKEIAFYGDWIEKRLTGQDVM